MTLGYMTSVNGHSSLFAEKVIRGSQFNYGTYITLLHEKFPKLKKAYEASGFEANTLLPKFHTIRLDPKSRWREGMNIHAVVKNQTKDRYQFLPIYQCKRIQIIEIRYTRLSDGFEIKEYSELDPFEKVVEVLIDGKYYGRSILSEVDSHASLTELAQNDGFDTASEFFEWFKNDFCGKIIHWTEIKY
jgi:hypothetical protein